MNRRQIQGLVDCAQVRREPLDELVRIFGGRVRVGGSHGGQNGGVFYWRMYGQKAGRVLEAVLPYLILKRPQAELVLELIAQQGGPGKFRTDAVYLRGLLILEQIRALNMRGPRRAERLSESAPKIESDLRMMR
jgi:hypothetical protein